MLSNTTFAELEENYYIQAKYLVEGGVDVLLVETAQDILEVKAAVAGFERLFSEIGRRVAIQAQVTLDTSGRMLLGTDIASAMTTLEALRVDVIGLNCSTGPEHMREPIRFLADNSTRPVSCIPNAGLPLNTGTGDAVYPLEPEPMAEMLGEFVEQFGVRIVGGCCGTRPEHLKAIVARVSSHPLRATASGGSTVRIANQPRRNEVDPPAAARPEDDSCPAQTRLQSPTRLVSAMRATDFDQNPKPLLIGERVNAQGSRKVKRLLLADDYEAIADVAREQVESGAHVLDVCVAVTERADEAEQMAKVVKLLSMTVEAPIMIDSTEADVIERALEAIPGRAIINSINMENGRERIDRVVPLAKKHGAALVALTIDPIGMAKTRERKLEVAKKIYDIVVGEYGLAPEDLIYDDLTFTLATGDAGVDRLGGRDDRRHSAHQARAARRLHQPRRLERELRPRARSARRAQLRLPASLRGSGARHGDRESGARAAVRRDSDRRARAGGRARVQSPARRAAAVHRAFRRNERATQEPPSKRKIRRPA